MTPARLQISQLGPLSHTDLEFGDLTIFTGPQAAGKSIALQMLKLVIDLPYVKANLLEQGLIWQSDDAQFFDLYLGEGMRSVWRKGTSVKWEGESHSLRTITRKADAHDSENTAEGERVAYIPAQRVMSLRDGFTRPFGEYRAGDPYALRDFSHNVHLTVQGELTLQKFQKSVTLFPRQQRFNAALRRLIENDVLGGWSLAVAATGLQREFVLTPPKESATSGAGEPLRFLTWSAGQREFVPLLLGLYRLLPAGSVHRRDNLQWAIIEEPESGLHPRAIAGFMAFVFELLRRKYKVVISTHSPTILDFVWGMGLLRRCNGTADDAARFVSSNPLREIVNAAQSALDAEMRVYYFERNKETVDISGLDPDSELIAEADWGGLTAFSNNVAEVVTKVVQEFESMESGG